MQFKQNREKALQNYINALSKGGTRTLPELYRAAGLEFNFSPGHIRELMAFVKDELIALEK
jgi:oligoendopeptidase F